MTSTFASDATPTRRAGDDPYVKALVEEHWEHAMTSARIYHRSLSGFFTLDEIQSEASFGLFTAARLYDPERGVKFWSFTRHFIMGRMREWVRHSMGFRRPKLKPLYIEEVAETPSLACPWGLQRFRRYDALEACEWVCRDERDRSVTRRHWMEGATLDEVAAEWRLSESMISKILRRVRDRAARLRRRAAA